MRRFLILLIFVLYFCFSVQAEAKNFALLVGVDEYENVPSLPSCVSDMTLLQKALKNVGFKDEEIQILKTGGSLRELPTKKKIEQKIDEILSEAKSSDVVFLAFSGHGAQDGKKTYFCPPDMDAKELEGTCVSFTKMMRALTKCPAKNKWVVVDAIRIAPAQDVQGFKGKALQSIPAPPAGIMLFQCCSEGEVSNVGLSSGHGFFVKNLALALSGEADIDLDGSLTLREVLKWTSVQTKAEVEKVQNKSQKPVSSGLFQDYTLMKDPNVPKAKKLVTEAKAAMDAEDYDLAVEKFDAALALCPKFNSWRREREDAQNLLEAKQKKQEQKSSGDAVVKPARNIPAGTRKVVTVDGVKYAFRWCPPGEFMMGAADGEKDAEAVHKVKLTEGFWLLETEVTQKMWQSIMGKNPSYFKGNKHPVEKISRSDCQEFCGKLSQKLGQTVKLPTEAQWEYACRAGEKNDAAKDFYGIAWYSDNSDSKTQQVGMKDPNAWGLYDMHGNVAEWCSDYYDPNYYSNSPTRDPENRTIPQSANGRRSSQSNQYSVCRGGNWRSSVKECRSTYRSKGLWNYRTNYVGLRIVLLDDDEIPENETIAESGPKDPGLAAGTRKVLTVAGVEFTFRWCPPGEFMMGGEAPNGGTKPVHKVNLTEGFWLLETEITQAQWKAVMKQTVEEQAQKMLDDDTVYSFDGGFGEKTLRERYHLSRVTNLSSLLCGQGPNLPMYFISWNESVEFCRKLSALLKQEIKLPTEAQWEYACRAGGLSENTSSLDSIAWHSTNSSRMVHPVGTKTPNAWGLHDMIGNVWEWCSDLYDADYYSVSPINDPTGPRSGSAHAFRGGCWFNAPWCCQPHVRFSYLPEYRYTDVGLRILMVYAPNQSRDVKEPASANLPSSDNAAGTRKVLTVDGVEYAFRWCPPGEFMMGSTNGDPDEMPVHNVKMTKGFWMLETNVTQAMWKSVMGENPSRFQGDRNPVEQVSWNDCQLFCLKLSEKLGQYVHLPTEAQWEYACRAGTTGDFAGDLNEMAWYQGNSDGKIHEVGLKKPNAWGLYDMHGSVREWCLDYFDEKYYERSPSVDPENVTPSHLRAFRSGAWHETPPGCRSADRSGFWPDRRSDDHGFRIVFAPGRENFAGKRRAVTVDGVEYAFRWCPPGEFTMGSGKNTEETVHQVNLTKGFWLLETEVTQAMWRSVMGETVEKKAEQGTWNHELRGSGDSFPMYYVSWNDAQEFCQKLGEKLHMTVKLPTEAQWEYACRAGSVGDYAGDLDSIAWHWGNADNSNHEVAQKKPNAWGLYDMHGNVWEWCSDYFGETYYANSPTSDPENGTPSSEHSVRGGAWNGDPEDCRFARRGKNAPEYREAHLGFRVALIGSKD